MRMRVNAKDMTGRPMLTIAPGSPRLLRCAAPRCLAEANPARACLKSAGAFAGRAPRTKLEVLQIMCCLCSSRIALPALSSPTLAPLFTSCLSAASSRHAWFLYFPMLSRPPWQAPGCPAETPAASRSEPFESLLGVGRNCAHVLTNVVAERFVDITIRTVFLSAQTQEVIGFVHNPPKLNKQFFELLRHFRDTRAVAVQGRGVVLAPCSLRVLLL